MLNSFFLWLMSLFMRKKTCSKGSSMIMGTIIAAVIVGVLALKSTGMTDLSFASFTSAGDVTIAQEYALSRAESMRAAKYSDLADVPLRKISDSDGFYEEVSLSDSFLNAFVNGSNIGVSGKNIDVKIYKGDGEDRKLCTALSLNRVDPVSFDSEINMVTNDSDSDSLYKAMSADAFKDLVDSKVTDDKNSESDNLCLSASALKEYLKDKLKVYSKTSDSVWYDGNSAVGSDYQGVYVKATGEVLPGSVVYRGNVTNAPHAFVIVPVLGSDNIWHYDFVDRTNLYTKFIDQLYFTFTITQSSHQTITVTTGDGIKHTETFSIKYGQTWTAEIVSDTGYLVGTLSATEGTARSPVEVHATAAVDMRTLLKIEKYGSSPNSAFAGFVGGQGNTTAGYNAAQRLLDNYENTKDKWVECVSGGYHGHGISYKTTGYQAFRITYPWDYPGMEIKVRFVTTDGGNGSVDGKVTEITQWHKEVRIVGHGGRQRSLWRGQTLC